MERTRIKRLFYKKYLTNMKKDKFTKKDIKDITSLIDQNKEIERINMRKILAVGEWEDLMKRIEVLENFCFN